jgi:hypothetical protein
MIEKDVIWKINYKPRSLYYQPKQKFYLLKDKKHPHMWIQLVELMSCSFFHLQKNFLALFNRYIKVLQNLLWLFCLIFLLYILIPHLLARKRPMNILFWFPKFCIRIFTKWRHHVEYDFMINIIVVLLYIIV